MHVDNFDSRVVSKLCNRLASAALGVIIDHHDLVRPAGLGQHAAHGVRQRIIAPIGRDQDRDAHDLAWIALRASDWVRT